MILNTEKFILLTYYNENRRSAEKFYILVPTPVC